MKLGSTDYLLARLSNQLAAELVMLGDVETRRLGARLAAVPLQAPVFIAGLARSGTTILLSVLAAKAGVATHRYRDFPFVFTPTFWSRFQDRFAGRAAPVERPHKDRILITKESPDAFEEPIWQHFFPAAHDPGTSHILDRRTDNPAFETFFKDHLRKILLLRGGDRYLSKGNYNVTRLDYLARLFPDARALVPVRHPLGHVASLVRQHRQFMAYARDDARIGRYLQIAGHYEFGPQRAPIHVTAEGAARIAAAWRDGDDHRGYAILWAEVYRHVLDLQALPDLAPRLHVVAYEALCADAARVLDEVTTFAGLAGRPAVGGPAQIAPPADRHDLGAAAAAVIWQETAPVAERLGYRADAPAL